MAGRAAGAPSTAMPIYWIAILKQIVPARDISYIPTAQGVLYSIVAYHTSPQQSVSLVLDTIRSAMTHEKVAGSLYLHSDEGFQYTSEAYFNLIQENGITPSVSRCANPYDNALAENFTHRDHLE